MGDRPTIPVMKKKQLQWLQRSQSKSVAERSHCGRKPCGRGIRQMTENRLELLTKKEAAQSRLSLHL